MKQYDDVRVINDNETYAKEGVYKGMIGHIAMPEIRNNSFYVAFIDENFVKLGSGGSESPSLGNSVKCKARILRLRGVPPLRSG